MLGLLIEIRRLGCKLVETFIEQNHKLCEAQEDVIVGREFYQKLVSKLIYLSHIIKNIAFAVEMVS